ncbi:unnamed protein product, partial [Allacma fusca]
MKLIAFFSILSFFSLNLHTGEGAKILFFYGIGSYSHRVCIQPLVEKLADLGHDVHVFSTTKPEKPYPNVTEVLPDFSAQIAKDNFGGDLTKSGTLGRLKDKFYDPLLEGNNLWDLFIADTERMVDNEEFRKWANTAKYDLILYNHAGKHFAVAVAYKMRAKIITFMPAGVGHMFDSDLSGLPIESSWFPLWHQGSPYFFIPDRFLYAYHQLAWYFSAKWYYFPRLDELARRLYPEDNIPPSDELLRNADLYFINEHYSTGYPRAFPPFVVPIGGMHLKESTGKLPKDVDDFIATAERIVFISFGSLIKVSDLPTELQRELIATVGSFNDTKFLWKWEGEVPQHLPDNVLAKKWFPQNDILGHTKCKGFVTQGGQMSVQQAAFHGVPMIVVPVWADQPFNAKSQAYNGNGIHLDLEDITRASFSHSIREILDNPKYSRNAGLVSLRIKDRPLSPVDTAAWWVEYVLRHDTAHLKSPGLVVLFSILSVFSLESHTAESAKILFFYGIGSYSHRVCIQPLVEKLADLGHDVHVFSTTKPEKPYPNVTEVLPDFSAQIAKDSFGGGQAKFGTLGRLKDKFYDPLLEGNNLWDIFIADTVRMVENEDFRNWVNTAKYDLILYNHAGKHLAFALAYKMGAKIITFMPAGVGHMFDSDLSGLPIESSWYPLWHQGSPYFFIPDRFFYAYHQLAWYFSAKWYYFPRLDKLATRLYPEDNIPPLDELLRNADLYFINEHYSTGYPRALPPFVVPIGGMHLKESTGNLPTDIYDFIATADRIVFISFGSVIKISDLPVELQRELIATVGSFTDTSFIWKWDGEVPQQLPKNVLAKKWFPQNDILGHPKCKGFVTQGGQMSVQQDITRASFSHAIREILDNPKYSRNAGLVSLRIKDRPLSPVDTAAWWVEYVLRHETAHLKSPGVYQSWWQRR